MATKSWLPKVKVAACNVSPIFLNTRATLSKTTSLIREAAQNNADLVVFPETHLPGYPLWAALSAPIDNHALFHRLASQSLLINGPEIRSLQRACADNRVWAHVGFNERANASVGCLWNSAVLVDDEGRVRNHQRKLVPTFYEKLVWAGGDGRGLRVVDGGGRVGRVGALICGENTNPLARFSLMAQGEQLHISTWPAVWPTRRPASKAAAATSSSQESPATASKQYDNITANRTRTAAHCFEAKCFGIMCAGYMDRNMRETITSHAPSAAETLDSLTQGQSCFLDPSGALVGESIQGEEGIVYADLDLEECVEPKQFHDAVGYYQRFDVFDLKVDRRRLGVEGMFVDDEEEGDVRAAEGRGGGDVVSGGDGEEES
ncbi:hypothetical protein Q7P37_006338 [Cladosporium fusiforme]